LHGNKSNETRELHELRANIQSVTKSIIDLVGAREKLSEQVARIKQRRGLPIENLKVESNLAIEVGAYAKSVGVSESLAKAILAEILDSSKVIQREQYYSRSIREFLEAQGIRTAGIIGAGRMGGWFASYFSHIVPKVLVFDSHSQKAKNLAKRIGSRARNKTTLEAIAQEADIFVVCVPIGKTVPMIRRLHNLCQPNRVIIEITSVKAPISLSGLLADKSRKAKILSLHPLFGPDANPFGSNLMVYIKPSSSGSDASFVSHLFPHYKILTLTPDEHDRAMAYILGLAHILALSFAKVVSENTELQARLQSGLIGPSFERIVQLSSRVLSENPNVYYEIQSLNKHNAKMLSQLEDSLKELKHSRSDRGKFKKIFASAKGKTVFRLPR
jgi:chorismate mutase/prephenate dehydrogenase